MLAHGQKREEFLHIYENLCKADENFDAEKELKRLLLKDSNDGKLYKYRCFCENHINSLREGTLYLSFPEAFNDPFDCLFGTSLLNFSTAFYNQEVQLLEDVLEGFFKVAIGEVQLESLSENVREKVLRLLQEDRFISVAQNVNNWSKFIENKGDIRELSRVTAEIITEVLSDESFALIRDNASAGIRTSLDLLNESSNVLSLDENMSPSEFVARVGLAEDVDDNEALLLLAQRADANSPNDMVSLKESVIKFQKPSRDLTRLFRIGSLTTELKSNLMWAHYADSHRGFCVEYDFKDVDVNQYLTHPMPVLYSNLRPQFPYELWLKETEERNGEHFEKLRKEILLALLTKDVAWEYENEWRIVMDARNSNAIKMPPISCVYLGVAISNENRKLILDIAKEKGFPVKQMKPNCSKYELHAESVMF